MSVKTIWIYWNIHTFFNNNIYSDIFSCQIFYMNIFGYLFVSKCLWMSHSDSYPTSRMHNSCCMSANKSGQVVLLLYISNMVNWISLNLPTVYITISCKFSDFLVGVRERRIHVAQRASIPNSWLLSSSSQYHKVKLQHLSPKYKVLSDLIFFTH